MKTKPKLIIAALCTAISFNANANVWSWFGNSAGDDGNSKTVGNQAAKKSLTQIMFNINNTSFGSIARVEIINSAGKSVYSGQFTCAMGKTCNLPLRNINISTAIIMKFFNSSNQLVTAYVMSTPPATINNVILNDTWLGIYAFNQLAKTTKTKPMVLNDQLQQFFSSYSSPDNTPDIFEELGLYFTAQSGGKNEAAFYAKLNTALKANETLPAKITPKRAQRRLQSNIALSVNATPRVGDSVMCETAMSSTFSYMGAMTGLIPVVGGGISAIFGIGNQIMSDACPNGNDQILQRLNAIENTLKEFNSKLDTLGFSIAELSKVIDTNQANNTLQTMNTNYSQLSTDYFTVYSGIVGSTNLATYVSQNGGLRKAHANSQQIKNLLSKIPTQLNNFDKLLSNDQIVTIKKSLDNLCSKPTAYGDIISTRINCNVATNKVLVTLDSSALRLKPLIEDEINTIAEALKSGNIDTKWLINNASEKFVYESNVYEWSAAAAGVNKIIDAKVNFINSTLVGSTGEKLYKPLDGLSTQLSQNMINAKCSSGALPAILEWHTADTVEPYIVTQCDDNGTKVKSKYYYQKRGSKDIDSGVVNIMGVLVPQRFFNGGSGNNYGDSNAFPWLDYSIIAANSINDRDINGNEQDNWDDLKVSANLKVPNNTTASVYGFGPSDASNSTLYYGQKNQVENFSRNGTNYSRNIFTKSTSSTVDTYLISYFGADWWRIADGELFTFVRYTPDAAVNVPNQQGYSYVFAMRSRLLDNTGGARVPFLLRGTMQCMTNNCTTQENSAERDQNAPQFYGKIKFDDAMSIGWATSATGNTHISNRTYDMTVNGTKAY